MAQKSSWGIFDRFGVELEYMICDKATMNVLPITDRILHKLHGSYVNEVDLGDNIGCSNELQLHVIEFKTIEPEKEITDHLAKRFQRAIDHIGALVKEEGAVLVPGAMHPWMDPKSELKLWTHDYNPIYEAYNRIFQCQGHGWANLQSTHLNISFSSDEELCALHSAIRLLLPIMPALSASSPCVDGSISGMLDTRLYVYKDNQKKIPSIAGAIVPEPILSQKEYFSEILEPMWHDIKPHDHDNILQEEWLNSRGAIVRFERMAIEIRVLDIQENPIFDLAILRAIIHALKIIAEKIMKGIIQYNQLDTHTLHNLFFAVARDGRKAQISDAGYLEIFGVSLKNKNVSVQDLWKHILGPEFLQQEKHVQFILNNGALAERMLSWTDRKRLPGSLFALLQNMNGCLESGIALSHKASSNAMSL